VTDLRLADEGGEVDAGLFDADAEFGQQPVCGEESGCGLLADQGAR
jgi:hypothetical protein